jgi:predicted PurR-regulated permease PerM
VETDSSSNISSLMRSRLWPTSWWKTVGVLTLGFAIGLGVLAVLSLFAYPIGLLFLAICIASALSPLVHRLMGRMSRRMAIIVVYVALSAIIGLIFAILLPPLVAQIKEFARRTPEIVGRLRQFLAENDISTAQLNDLMPETGDVGEGLITIPISVFSGLFDALVVLFISLYLLIDAPKLHRFILSLFGSPLRERVDSVGTEMVQIAGGYVRGVVIDIVLMSIMSTIGLSLIGLPFALGLGVMTGLFEALPVVGAMIAAIPVLIVALLQSPTMALITLVFVVILQVVQGNIISPYVMKNQAEVPQFLVPLAILAGGAAGGILGALISLPVVAVVRVFLLRVVAPFIRQQTGAERQG